MAYYIYKMLNKKDEIIYIGQTTNLYNRINIHMTKCDENIGITDKEEIDRVFYTLMKSKSDMYVMEAYLIAKYKPRFNKDFCMDDELSLRLVDEELEWFPYLNFRDDNPNHNYRVYKDGELLYEFPKVHELYDPLAKKLGLTVGMNIPYGIHIKDGEYEVSRISAKRRINNGSMVVKPKYKYGQNFQFRII